MPSLRLKYKLDDIDLAKFPNAVNLQHGQQGKREWWEWRDRENHKSIPKHLDFIVESSNGNMRTAENTLEQVCQIKKGKETKE